MTIRFLVPFLLALLCLGAQPRAAEAVPDSAGEIKLTFAPLVRQTAPAVVNIFTKTVVRERRVNPLFSDPFFRQFFGDRFGLGGGTRERIQNSLGSGVIVDSGGLIVTNNHVIEGADEISVVLSDRREFSATLVGVDEQTDIALLRIEAADPLPFIEFRDSEDIEVGDLVLAIGNPFGVGQTVTSGIISGLARTQVGVADIGSFIQTDAAVNPGNSGGALITTDGRLVGINTAIFSKSGGSLGIGFAVPSNLVRFVIESIVEGGRVIRPWLGAFGQPVTGEIASALGLDRPFGVLVNDVWPSGPAEEGGIRAGDVLTAINGKEVNSPAELGYRFGSLSVGGEATVSVVRDGSPMDLAVRLALAPEEPPREVTIIKGPSPLAGLKVANMSPALAEDERLDDIRPGVVILGVAKGSPAARLRLRRGDRVVEVNGAKVGDVRGLLPLIERAANRWSLGFVRNGQRINLVVG